MDMLTTSSAHTKPTSSMTKSVLFNVLIHNPLITQNISESVIMDAFCGTGSVGFEFISLGAKKCYFVDKNTDRLLEISNTARKFGVENKVETILSDIVTDTILISEKIDILFLDPPYTGNEGILFHFLNSFCNYDNMSDSAIVSAELPRTLCPDFNNLEKIVQRNVNKNTDCIFWKMKPHK